MLRYLLIITFFKLATICFGQKSYEDVELNDVEIESTLVFSPPSDAMIPAPVEHDYGIRKSSSVLK